MPYSQAGIVTPSSYNAEGQDAGYSRLPCWMLQVARIHSRPDILLLEDSKQALGLRLPSCTFWRSPSPTILHSLRDLPFRSGRTSSCAGCCMMLTCYIISHAIVVGHTGVMANGNRGILGALRVRPSRLAECLHQMATLGCRYSSAMLKASGRDRFHRFGCGASPRCARLQSTSACFAGILWDGHNL